MPAGPHCAGSANRPDASKSKRSNRVSNRGRTATKAHSYRTTTNPSQGGTRLILPCGHGPGRDEL
jgi:hypothetical protein